MRIAERKALLHYEARTVGYVLASGKAEQRAIALLVQEGKLERDGLLNGCPRYKMTSAHIAKLRADGFEVVS